MKKIVKVSPRPFDLGQKIMGALPIDLINQWRDSDQGLKSAKRILEPLKVKGIMVSSDSSGLCLMGQTMNLIDVLLMINLPKEIIYSYGRALGGEGIGVWAADNTQMFYPRDISPEDVLSMLLTVQNEISKKTKLTISIGAHLGEFYKIGDGLYGTHADFIEYVTEELLSGGDLAVSEQLVDQLGNKFKFLYRADIYHKSGKIFNVAGGPLHTQIEPKEFDYPIPYSENFYKALKEYEISGDKEKLKIVYEKFVQKKVVVLVEREKDDNVLSEISLLNDISLYLTMNQKSDELLTELGGEEIKIAGNLGIYVFDKPKQALDFSIFFREQLQKENIRSKIGIDCGDVVICQINNDIKDIAGQPVNVASKMAQDCGEFGKIYITEKTVNALASFDKEEAVPCLFEISRIKINAFEI